MRLFPPRSPLRFLAPVKICGCTAVGQGHGTDMGQGHGKDTSSSGLLLSASQAIGVFVYPCDVLRSFDRGRGGRPPRPAIMPTSTTTPVHVGRAGSARHPLFIQLTALRSPPASVDVI